MKVRCIDNAGSGGSLIYGQIYQVKGTRRTSSGIMLYYLVDNDMGSWFASRFEIVEEKTSATTPEAVAPTLPETPPTVLPEPPFDFHSYNTLEPRARKERHT